MDQPNPDTSTEAVKRYHMDALAEFGQDAWIDERQCSNGAWVRFTDYAALEAKAARAITWSPMTTAPKGMPTEDVGCRGASEWFIGRVAPDYAKGNPPFIVIRRCAWPNDDRWACAGLASYVPDFFDAWAALPETSEPTPA